MSFQIEITIGASDIQPIYQHVHHAHALRFLEAARLSYLQSIGFSSDRLIEEGILPVIREVRVRYKRELRAGNVRVTCEDAHVEGPFLRVRQRIINEEGLTAVEARVDSVLMSARERKLIIPTEKFCQAFARPSGNS